MSIGGGNSTIKFYMTYIETHWCHSGLSPLSTSPLHSDPEDNAVKPSSCKDTIAIKRYTVTNSGMSNYKPHLLLLNINLSLSRNQQLNYPQVTILNSYTRAAQWLQSVKPVRSDEQVNTQTPAHRPINLKCLRSRQTVYRTN